MNSSNVVSIESRAPAWRPLQWERPERTVVELVDDYVAWGKAFGRRDGKGWSCGRNGRTGHAGNVSRQLRFWIEALDLRVAGDLKGCLFAAERALATLKAGAKTGQMSLEYKSNDANSDPKSGESGIGSRESGRSLIPDSRFPTPCLSDTSLRSYGAALKSFCAWLVNREMLAENPVRKLALPRATCEKKGRAMTLDEIHALLNAAPAKRRTLYEMALVTGLRANELRSLQVADLDDGRSAVRLSGRWTKNRSDGLQALPGRMLATIRAYGLPSVPRQTARTLKADLARAGIRGGGLVFHSLRKTFATLLDQARATEKEQQFLLRHAAKSLTFGVYTQTLAPRLAELVEAVAAMIVPAKREAMLWD